MGMAHDRFSGASEQHVGDGAAAVCAEDDDVRTPFFCRGDDLLRRLSLLQDKLWPGKRYDRGREAVEQRLPHLAMVSGKIGAQHGELRRQSDCAWNGMNKRQRCAMNLGQSGRHPNRPLSRFAVINRNQDALENAFAVARFMIPL
jgi:hypothetical protein